MADSKPPDSSRALLWTTAPLRRLQSPQQSLEMSLPDALAWDSLPQRGGWSGWRHELTDTELWIRHVPARRTVTVEECQREAEVSLTYLRERLPIAQQEPVAMPQGYGGQFYLAFLPHGGAQLSLHSVALSRCLSVVFRSGAKNGWVERIRVAKYEIFPSLRILNVAERGARQPAL